MRIMISRKSMNKHSNTNPHKNIYRETNDDSEQDRRSVLCEKTKFHSIFRWRELARSLKNQFISESIFICFQIPNELKSISIIHYKYEAKTMEP